MKIESVQKAVDICDRIKGLENNLLILSKCQEVSVVIQSTISNQWMKPDKEFSATIVRVMKARYLGEIVTLKSQLDKLP